MRLKAVRFLKDQGKFKAGEIIPLNAGYNPIIGPYGVGKSTLLYEIAYHRIGGVKDVIECSYDDGDSDTRIDYCTVLIDFTATPAVVITDIPEPHRSNLQNLAIQGAKDKLIPYLVKHVRDALILLDEPRASLWDYQRPIHNLSGVVGFANDEGCVNYVIVTNQVLEACGNGPLCGRSQFSVGNKCWVSEKYVRYHRRPDGLTTQIREYSPVGFVVRLQRKHSHLDEDMYLAGKRELISDPTCAYVYQTREAAEKAINSVIGSWWDIKCRRSFMGRLFYSSSPKNLPASCYEILTRDQYDEILFGGPVTKINYGGNDGDES